MKLPNAELALIDLRKLRNYSLNAQHDRGQHKARLFQTILGLSSDDAEILQALIQAAIQINEAVPTTIDEYGQRYTVDFPVSRSQNTVIVRTVWIVRSTETFPRLVSCYILR